MEGSGCGSRGVAAVVLGATAATVGWRAAISTYPGVGGR